MKHLSKEKKQHLLLVVIGTLIILVGLWFGLISWQQENLSKLTTERDATKIKLEGMEDTIQNAAALMDEVNHEKARLAEAESQMASGDLYAWIINTIRTFKAKHPKVDIPQYSTILVEDTKILPKFPYQQATLTVSGKACYHDLGRFIADFENEFPYIRIENLDIQRDPGSTGTDFQKLAFRMDVVALIKPEA